MEEKAENLAETYVRVYQTLHKNLGHLLTDSTLKQITDKIVFGKNEYLSDRVVGFIKGEIK